MQITRIMERHQEFRGTQTTLDNIITRLPDRFGLHDESVIEINSESRFMAFLQPLLPLFLRYISRMRTRLHRHSSVIC